MKGLLVFRRLSAVLTVILAGTLLVAVLSVASAKEGELPAYLQKATFRTSGKCKMCHKAEFANWSNTKHAQMAAALPWEKAPAKPGEKPAPELVARHVTGFDAAAGTWAEKGVSCEACHGPGSEHMAAKKDERKTTISNPAALATPTQQVSVCGRCHGQYSIGDKRFADKFQPGQDLFTMEGFKLDDVKPDCAMQELNELAQSTHLKKGVVCTTCHLAHAEKPAAHSLKKPVTELCLECHKEKTMAAHAPTAKEGDTCATCHMPGGRHTFAAPKP